MTQDFDSYITGKDNRTVDYNCISLDVWLCTAKGAKSKKENAAYNSRISLANIWLTFNSRYNTDEGVTYPPFFNEPEDGNGIQGSVLLLPGFMKNNIQQIVAGLKNEKKYSNDDIVGNNVKKLAGETLFIPEWVVKNSNKSEDFFNSYSNPYKVLEGEELNNKIETEDKPFYYVSVLNGGYKFFNVFKVVDSKSGEIIFLQSSRLRNYKDQINMLQQEIKNGK